MYFFGRYGKLNDIKHEIRWFFQRGRKGYSDRDLWELDTWFATTFSRMLMEFSEKTDSYPPGFGAPDQDKYIDKSVSSQAIALDEDGDKYLLAWKFAVKEAAEQFASSVDYSYKTPTEELKENRDKAFEFIRKYFYNLWW